MTITLYVSSMKQFSVDILKGLLVSLLRHELICLGNFFFLEREDPLFIIYCYYLFHWSVVIGFAGPDALLQS